VREPDLVIWLQAPTSTLLQRIRRRAITMEQDIAPDYLERLAEGYAAHFQSYDGAPVFAVATELFNPADRETDFALLIDRLAAFQGWRGYLDVGACPALT